MDADQEIRGLMRQVVVTISGRDALAEELTITAKTEPICIMLEVSDLSKRLPDGRVLFHDISFTVKLDRREPTVLAVRGPSGCGKTTLLKCLAQLIPYDGGSVTLHGRYGAATMSTLASYSNNITQLTRGDGRAAMADKGSRPPALPGTPKDFLGTMKSFAAQKSRDKLDTDPIAVAAKWGLSEDAWEKDWNQLSGGEIQRIAMAIAVGREPDVLLLDEPTSALDPETTRLVEQTLTQYNCLWITHSPEQEARVATRSLVMDRDENGGHVSLAINHR
ncbi:hypothetical protein HK101_000564 [Irineochytrium annulatum]|nr:hypothetical protein HK101_000564 [Irineochytrium annulatum]